MKTSKFKKLLLTLALIIIVQNGVIVVSNLPEDTYTCDDSVSPCNDEPLPEGCLD